MDFAQEQLEQQVFRFEYGESFLKAISLFACEHQNENRHAFKCAWGEWLRCNEMLVSIETQSLQMAGFGGNIIDRMYHSARYYFRKKSCKKTEEETRCDPRKNEELEKKKLKTYNRVDKCVLLVIDSHLSKTDRLKPSIAFQSFIEDDLSSSIVATMDTMDMEALKKTYKNRFYKHHRK